MKRSFTSARIGLAIFLGVLAGPSVASHWFEVGVPGLVLASLVGGSVAWALCDPMRLLRAFGRALKVVGITYTRVIEYTVSSLITVPTVFLSFVVFMEVVIGDMPPVHVHDVPIYLWFWLWLLLSTSIGFAFTLSPPTSTPSELLKIAIKYINPIAIVFWIMVGVGKCSYYLVTSMPVGARYLSTELRDLSIQLRALLPVVIERCAKHTAKVAVLTFRYYHDTDTRICFIDTAIFSGLAFWNGVPFDELIYWALGGALFGILNYEVVTVRILKIAPSLFERH